MKYLVIFLISFSFFSQAFAAMSVKGTVPNIKPLQPAPEGISPNYSGNIQYSPDSASNGENPEEKVLNEKKAAGILQNDAELKNQATTDAGFSFVRQSKSFLILFLFILITAGGAYIFFRDKE
jgi:hypothetical protein